MTKYPSWFRIFSKYLDDIHIRTYIFFDFYQNFYQEVKICDKGEQLSQIWMWIFLGSLHKNQKLQFCLIFMIFFTFTYFNFILFQYGITANFHDCTTWQSKPYERFIPWFLVVFGDEVTRILRNSLFTFFTEQGRTGKTEI